MSKSKMNNENIREIKQKQDANYYRKYINMYVEEIDDELKLKKIYEYVHAVLVRSSEGDLCKKDLSL